MTPEQERILAEVARIAASGLRAYVGQECAGDFSEQLLLLSELGFDDQGRYHPPTVEAELLERVDIPRSRATVGRVVDAEFQEIGDGKSSNS